MQLFRVAAVQRVGSSVQTLTPLVLGETGRPHHHGDVWRHASPTPAVSP